MSGPSRTKPPRERPAARAAPPRARQTHGQAIGARKPRDIGLASLTQPRRIR